MVVVAGTAVGMWTIAVVYRVQDDAHSKCIYHLWVRKDSTEELHRSMRGTVCSAPFWPRYWRTLLGQPWPGSYKCRCNDRQYAINGQISQGYVLVGSRTGTDYGVRWFAGPGSWESIEPWDFLIREYQNAQKARPVTGL